MCDKGKVLLAISAPILGPCGSWGFVAAVAIWSLSLEWKWRTPKPQGAFELTKHCAPKTTAINPTT